MLERFEKPVAGPRANDDLLFLGAGSLPMIDCVGKGVHLGGGEAVCCGRESLMILEGAASQG